MGEGTAIEWADHTFNPWWGCARVSPACQHCYAETLARRFGTEWGSNAERRFFGDKHWNEPLRWDRSAAKAGVRARVFCASMADVFEDRPDLIDHRARLWDLVEQTTNLDWLLLTKRPENVLGMVPIHWHGDNQWPANAWVGTTVENQRYADERIPHLLDVPAPVLFLSCEPLLGPVDLGEYLPLRRRPDVESVSWVIAGGESGPGARPMNREWVRSLRDQATQTGVAFLFKQWGDWCPKTRLFANGWIPPHDYEFVEQDGMIRVGKKATGRRLDGRTWDEVPDGHV